MFSLKEKIKAERHFLKRSIVPTENKIAEDPDYSTTIGADADTANEITEPAFYQSPAALRWDDIVFNNRNRDYGAYVLRKAYGRNVITGLVVTLLLSGLIIFGPALYQLLG